MRPELQRVGNGHHPVVIVDDFTGDVEEIVEVAAALAPFPRHSANSYPGHRRILTLADEAASHYVERLCTAAAPFIAGAFDVEGFDLLEASFSIVTTPPARLSPAQRAPHFDSTDPRYLALLHYVRVPEGTGTAFYRQRATGIEQVTEANVASFVRTAERAAAQLPPDSGYIRDTNADYEQVAAIAGLTDRLVIYQGSLLHSGIIPPNMVLSSDPREGRLTANIFVRAH